VQKGNAKTHTLTHLPIGIQIHFAISVVHTHMEAIVGQQI